MENMNSFNFGKLITDDYECKKDCRNCPFPGAKCFQTKYDRYDTGLLIKHKEVNTNGI